MPRAGGFSTVRSAKVSGGRYFNVLASSDTLLTNGATTGFPYRGALAGRLPQNGQTPEVLRPSSSLSWIRGKGCVHDYPESGRIIVVANVLIHRKKQW